MCDSRGPALLVTQMSKSDIHLSQLQDFSDLTKIYPAWLGRLSMLQNVCFGWIKFFCHQKFYLDISSHGDSGGAGSNAACCIRNCDHPPDLHSLLSPSYIYLIYCGYILHHHLLQTFWKLSKFMVYMAISFTNATLVACGVKVGSWINAQI